MIAFRRVAPRAFTLIELLVVIAIIAILAAILFPVFAQAKKAAKVSVTVSNQKQLALSIMMYSNDYDDVMPMTVSSLHPADPSAPWYGGNDFVGILQMTYPYTKNTDIWWSGTNPRLGSLPTPMVPGGVIGTWGDWSKEQTILPNNIALNVWDGANANIKPRSLTEVEEPAALGVFFPVVGPVSGVATWSTNLTDPMVDVDPWSNSCTPSYTDPNANASGWQPVYAAFVGHNRALPVAFADGHAAKVRQDAFFQDPLCNIAAVPNFDSDFKHRAYPNKLWGFYLQGVSITH